MRSLLELAAECEFDRGDEVFHVKAKERSAGILVCVHFFPGEIMYSVIWSDRSETKHYAMELSKSFVVQSELDTAEGEKA